MMHVFLDSSPLGLLTKPKLDPEVKAINDWLTALVVAGHAVYLPEVVDYELRRELMRQNRTASLALLDALGARLRYVPSRPRRCDLPPICGPHLAIAERRPATQRNWALT